MSTEVSVISVALCQQLRPSPSAHTSYGTLSLIGVHCHTHCTPCWSCVLPLYIESVLTSWHRLQNSPASLSAFAPLTATEPRTRRATRARAHCCSTLIGRRGGGEAVTYCEARDAASRRCDAVATCRAVAGVTSERADTEYSDWWQLEKRGTARGPSTATGDS